MSLLPARRIRCRINGETPTSLLDVNANDGGGNQAVPLFIRGNATDFEVGIFYDSAPVDASGFVELYLELWYNNTLILSKTLSASDIADTLDETNWDAGTAQHGTFELSNEDTNFEDADIGTPSGGATVSLNCEVTALMDDGRIHTLAIAAVNLLVPRHTVSGTPEVVAGSYYTQSQTNALLALRQLRTPASSSDNLKIYGSDGNLYQLGVQVVDGVKTLSLEQVAL